MWLLLLGACDAPVPKDSPAVEDSPGVEDSAPTEETGVETLPRWSGTIPITDAATATWVGENAADRAGRTVAPGGDLDADGAEDLLIGAYYFGDDGVDHLGRAYAFFGPIYGPETDRSLLEADVVITGQAEDHYVSRSFAGVGDTDGDGVDDLVVGAPNDTVGGRGRACRFRGPLAPVYGIFDGDLCMQGEADGDLAGGFVSGPGDLDGDGLDEMLVTSLFADGNAGAVYLVRGPGDVVDLGDADARFVGEASAYAGWFTAGAGDLDGDGTRDVLFGAPGSLEADLTPGVVYGLSGPLADGDQDLANADFRLEGPDAQGGAGASVAGDSDVDGDGRPDVLVGAPGTSEGSGAAYLVLAPIAAGAHSLADADRTWTGAEEGARTGWGLALPGDLDGDGLGEVLIGSYGIGAVSLLYGPAGVLPDANFTAETSGDYLGWFVAGAREADNHPGPDLILGAQRYGTDSPERGKVYFVPGAP